MSEKAILRHFKRIDPCTFAVRFSCQDRDLFDEITETIKSAYKLDRRWNPDLDDGRGAWELHESVLEDIADYFPPLKIALEKQRRMRPD